MYFLVFGSSLVVSLVLVPLVRQLGIRIGRVSKPREDRWHQNVTPTLGGVAMFIAMGVGLLTVALRRGEMWDEVHLSLLACSFLMFFLGLYDDFKETTPPAKLIGQILVAMVAIFFGYTTNFFTPKIANTVIAQIPNITLTFFWLIGITNAINLLDNMDGLAGGISLIAAVLLGYFFWRAGDTGLLVTSLALAGSILGFLVYNFPPASIFMGNSGSLFLGFTLAILAIARQPQASNVFAVMGVPTLLFLLPILDTTLVTVTRLLRGQSPAEGGRDHTSHRLIAFGLNERQAVLVLYGVALLAGMVGVAVETLDYWLSLVLVPLLVLSLALVTAYLGRLKVVVSHEERRAGTIARIFAELAYKRRLLEILLDFLLIGLAYYLAFMTYYGFVMNDNRLQLYLQTLPIAFSCAYLSFFYFGVYRAVWRYVGVDDLLRYLRATLASVVLLAAVLLVVSSTDTYFPTILILFGVFLFLGLATTRSSFKILDQAFGHQVRSHEARVLIIGAGDAGEVAVRWILMNPQLGYRAIGFLDNDPFLTGRKIHGVDVLGGIDQLEAMLGTNKVDGVVITTDFGSTLKLENLKTICRSRGIWTRALRLDFELLD